MEELRIKKILGTPEAILPNYGLQVAKEVKKYLRGHKKVAISFKGLRYINTSFCGTLVSNLHHSSRKSTLKRVRMVGLRNPNWKIMMGNSIDLVTHPKKFKRYQKALEDLAHS